MKRAAIATLLLCAAVPAQDQTFGGEYAFGERKPRSRLEQLVAAKLPSIVKIHGASGLATIRAYASGVIVSEQGHILTTDLIMIQADQTRVVLNDGSVHHAKLYPSNRKLGVRLLKIDPKGMTLTPQVLTKHADWPHGTFVMSLGNCYRLAEFSEKVSATFGVLTARARTGLRYRLADVDYDGELLITDAPNNPGHYGGGLFTLAGDWIGLNTRLVESKETNTQISAAIPTWDLVEYVERYTLGKIPVVDPQAGAPKRPVYHGITLFDRGIRRSPPAYVERVKRGSPARALGLRPDDLIVRIDEYAVRNCVQFRRVMAKFEPGSTVLVTYKRGNKVRRGELKLEETK